MKLIIAGSRTVNASPIEIDALVQYHKLNPTEVVSGTARGMDQCGERYAFKYDVKVTQFPADWDRFGKSAGHKRNAQMAEYADALLLIWDGCSHGSASMKALMIKAGKPVYEVVVDEI